MPIAPVREILVVKTCFGPGCPTSEGPSVISLPSSPEDFYNFLYLLERKFRLPIRYISIPQDSSRDRERLASAMSEMMREGTFVISNENSTSYEICRVLKDLGLALDALIVGDQHWDFYHYHTHGKELSKANCYRMIRDRGLSKFFIFFGARELEEAFLNPWPLLWKALRFNSSVSNLSNFLYAWMRYRQGQHAGFEGSYTAIPARVTREVPVALPLAKEMLNTIAGASLYGIELDLDMFDSHIIEGVDYGSHLPARLIESAWETYAKNRRHKGILRAWGGLVYNYWVASYIHNKISCLGMHVPTREEMRGALKIFQEDPERKCVYGHVTEFEPGADTPSALTTTRLVQDFTAEFIEASWTR